MHPIDNMEALLEARLERADCCILCGLLISSSRQIDHPGTDICDKCAKIGEQEKQT